MRYFLIKEDPKITQRPFILNLHDKLDIRLIHPESAYKLPERELVLIKSHPETVFTDIISSPLFLISEKIRKTVNMYEPRVPMKELVLLDKANGKAERYFLPIFEEVDCLGGESIFNLDHSEIRKIVLDQGRIGDHSIFRIAGVGKQYIIGNLDIVESILKRGCRGMQLEQLKYIPAKVKFKETVRQD